MLRMMQQQLPTNQGSGKSWLPRNNNWWRTSSLTNPKSNNTRICDQRTKGLLWVPLKDSYGSLSRTFHGRGKLPHLFDNFMCVLFLLFFVGEEGPCPFGAVLWGRGGVTGKRDWSFELWVGLCVCFLGCLWKVFLLNFQLLFCEKGLLCVSHTCFFSFLFNCFDVAGDWTWIHERN